MHLFGSEVDKHTFKREIDWRIRGNRHHDDKGGISSSLPQPCPSDCRVRHSGSITVPVEGHCSDRASPEAGDSASERSLAFPV